MVMSHTRSALLPARGTRTVASGSDRVKRHDPPDWADHFYVNEKRRDRSVAMAADCAVLAVACRP